MNWRDVWIYYRAELRGALRERTIVVNSLLIPTLLYPGMIFLALTGFTIVQSQTEGFVSRIELGGLPDEHAGLRERLVANERIELRSGDPEAAGGAIRRGRLDARVEAVAAATEGASLEENFRLRVLADSSKERSTAARNRITEVLDGYRDGWLAARATRLGIGPPERELFGLEERDLASGREIGAFILGLLLPLTFVVMVAIGCFNPAIDATAGERERNTWETTLTLATTRTSIVAAKYLYVATFGAVAGVLNLLALTVSMRAFVAPFAGEAGEQLEFSIPLAAWPVLLLCAALLAGTVGAAMMIFAAFARTFREGQSMVMPVYLISFLPAMLLNDPGLELEPRLALVPIGNIILVIREVVAGHFPWLEMGLTVVVQALLILLCVRLAALILRFEDVMVGSYGGNLFKFVQQRLRSSRPQTAGGASSGGE